MEQPVASQGANTTHEGVSEQDELAASSSEERKRVDECDASPSSNSRSITDQSTTTGTCSTTNSSLNTTATQITDTSITMSARLNENRTPLSLGEPTVTLIEIVSTVPTPSAFPTPFGVAISPKGLWIAAYSQSALYLLYARSLPKVQGDGFRISRKPVALAMQELSDRTITLAVLTTRHRIDLYSYGGGYEDNADLSSMIVHLRTIHLELETTGLTIAPTNDILATVCTGGVQLFHVGPGATDDETRHLKCDEIETISFSADGQIMLLTSAVKGISKPSIIYSLHKFHATPLTDSGSPIPQELHEKWLTRIHFPDMLKRVRQASILHDPSTGIVNELFGYDLDRDSWGIFDVWDQKFVGNPMGCSSSHGAPNYEMFGSALPAIAHDSRNVAIVFDDGKSCGAWVFEMPESYVRGVSAYQDAEEHKHAMLGVEPSICVGLSDLTIAQESVRTLTWVHPSTSSGDTRRLIAVSTQTTYIPVEGEHPLPKTASGRVSLIDFPTGPGPHSVEYPDEIQVNLDEALALQKLPDPSVAFDYEVHLARSRTTAERRRRRQQQEVQMIRDFVQATSSPEEARPINQVAYNHSLQQARARQERRRSSVLEGTLAIEEPYIPSQPRSQASLQRAATVAAASPAARRHLRAFPDRPLEYRRADGLREIPHESDADNWVPPPPPYSPTPDPSTPALTLRRSRSDSRGLMLEGRSSGADRDARRARRSSMFAMFPIGDQTQSAPAPVAQDGPGISRRRSDRDDAVEGGREGGRRRRLGKRCVVM